MPYVLQRNMSLALLQDVSSLNLAVLLHRLFFVRRVKWQKARRGGLGAASRGSFAAA